MDAKCVREAKVDQEWEIIPPNDVTVSLREMIAFGK